MKELAFEQEGFEFVHEEIVTEEPGAMTDAPNECCLSKRLPPKVPRAVGSHFHLASLPHGKLAKRDISYES